jgi:hypothetical protein
MCGAVWVEAENAQDRRVRWPQCTRSARTKDAPVSSIVAGVRLVRYALWAPVPLVVPPLLALAWSLCSCGPEPEAQTPTPPAPSSSGASARAKPGEAHFASVRQLTFGGENAEAYWSWAGDQLILQARDGKAQQCDRINRMQPFAPNPSFTPVSSGKGATTCSYFLPGDREVIYASTHLGGEACPPRPDHSKGYVWALYPDYDIFRGSADATGALTRLTDTPGYDAEGTVCGKDGSIVFTSVRDGDIDLYRMDADGKNVKRLTNTPGYDGGAFFNADCTKIVWRASRPKGKDLDDYKSLLAQNLVRPTKLELYVGNADGSDATQITYLDAASFAPFWHPSQRRILFSSNYGAPSPREFDIWAIDVDGTKLERVTTAEGFDGFPMFSPDGKWLAFSSNRATPAGQHDTNVFLAQWVENPFPPQSGQFPPPPPGMAPERAADRILRFDAALADPALEGRGVGTPGLDKAGAMVESAFKDAGLQPAGSQGFRVAFDVPTSVTGEAHVAIGGKPLDATDVSPLGFSSSSSAEGPLVFVGYGIVADGWDDYAHVDAKGKIVVARRFVPDAPAFAKNDDQRRHGDLRRKAWLAREHGAKALLVVDLPEKPKDPAAAKDWKMPDEARFPALDADVAGDAGIVAVVASRKALAPVVDRLLKKESVAAKLSAALVPVTAPAFDVVGRWPAGVPDAQKLPGTVLVGAHYDHLGYGGRFSLAPDKHEPHPGADDNASGTATLVEVARAVAASKATLRRDVVFAAFSGEEVGALGSEWLVKHPTPGIAPGDLVAMINMDMVGRLRDNTLQVFATDTATEWPDLLSRACDTARIECLHAAGGGFGASDHAPYYAAGVPVLHLFSGVHTDYHKPSDTPDKLNASGMAQVAVAVDRLARDVADHEGRLQVQHVPSPPPRGDVRGFGSSLGTVPDYAGPPKGQKGMLLAGVRPGGAADKAGLRHGDILVKLGEHVINGVEDLMYVLMENKPGTTMKAVVVRDGAQLTVDVTLQESARSR